jgi:DNA invertase Pin-like site-specific DNA recombinase
MPRKKKSPKLPDRRIALCYIRQSQTRDESDMDSPDRQRENIALVCEQHDWIPEWYEDVEGHKSGTKVKNRPGWLALKARLADPDVAALVANDLSRLHRKGWRVGDLLDFVDEHDVSLVLAAPGKQMDFSTPQGRIIAQLSAIFDEWYAVDISQRSKDSIKHRKRKGITVGLPPFGTVRGDDGYLQPSPEGAWYMPNGTFQAGEPNKAPDRDALWRSYYKAAERVLRLYAQNKHGLDTIAYQMQIDGWAFRDRNGNPTLFDGDDVRRIVANWAEYGGWVGNDRARDRHPHNVDIDAITLDEERAVFPLDLLYRVAEVRRKRTLRRPMNDGVKKSSYPYTLAGITYCAHCEALAKKHGDASLRSRFGGWTSNNGQTKRYRHKNGVKCGCTNRSVVSEVYEADFVRLLQLLTVKTNEIDLMTELGIQAAQGFQNIEDEQDLEAQKRAAIALCRRKIDAAVTLFGDGRITKEEYRRRVDQNEREIAHWEARTTETQRIALELTLCIDAIDKIANLWKVSEDEDRRGMARNLFSYVVYDLDTQRIVDFRLKPWADRFVTLRGALYGGDDTPPNTTNTIGSAGACKAESPKPVGGINLSTA